MASDSSDIDIDGILNLIAQGGLSELLNNEDVQKASLQEMADLGLKAPINRIFYKGLKKLTAKGEEFLGQNAENFIKSWIGKYPNLVGLLSKLKVIETKGKTQEELKSALLENLPKKISREYNIDNSALELDILIALCNKGSLEDLQIKNDQVLNELKTIQNNLAGYFNELYAPSLIFPAETQNQDDASATEKLHYSAGINTLHGREQELDILDEFCTGSQSFSWLLLTARGGEGKSRLAYHYGKKLRNKKWDAGFFKIKDLNEDHIFKWRARRPTLMIIDYVQLQPEKTRSLLNHLCDNERHYDFPVRILLLERQGHGSWVDKIVSNSDNGNLRQHHFQCKRFWPSGKDDPQNMMPKGMPLTPISKQALIALMRERFEKANTSSNIGDDSLFKAVCKIDPEKHRGIVQPRPLFAAAVADYLIETINEKSADLNYQDMIEGLTRDSVLNVIIDRDRSKRWKSLNPTDEELKAHERLLAFATLCQGFDINGLEDQESLADFARYLPDSPQNPQPVFSCNSKLLDVMGLISTDTARILPAIEPDILGEYFILEMLEDLNKPQIQAAMTHAALKIAPVPAAIVISRVANDFPDKFDHFHLFEIPLDSEETAVIFSMLSVDLVSTFGEAKEWPRVDSAFERLKLLRADENFKHNPDIALEDAKAMMNLIAHAGKAKEWPRVDSALERLKLLREDENFKHNPDIAIQEAKAMMNLMNCAGEAKEWDQVDRAVKRLDALRKNETFKHNPDIALREAKAMMNLITDAGEAKEWPRVYSALERLKHLREDENFKHNSDIALAEAKAMVNLIARAGKAKEWPRVDSALERLKLLREDETFKHNPDIALREAKAIYSIVICALEFENDKYLNLGIQRFKSFSDDGKEFLDYPEINEVLDEITKLLTPVFEYFASKLTDQSRE